MSVEAQSPAELEYARKEAEVSAENAKRTGVGTRLAIGKTRGKGSMIVSWEEFDESKPDTLPKDMKQFMSVTGIDSEATLLSYMISGYNAESYSAASDPLKEFVDQTWPSDVQTQFRLVVRNYAKGAGVDFDSAVALIKPGFTKQFTK